jgi:hypothetical protein
MSIGRGERIRTSDPLRPRQVRYQAALRPDRTASVPRLGLETQAELRERVERLDLFVPRRVRRKVVRSHG